MKEISHIYFLQVNILVYKISSAFHGLQRFFLFEALLLGELDECLTIERVLDILDGVLRPGGSSQIHHHPARPVEFPVRHSVHVRRAASTRQGLRFV